MNKEINITKAILQTFDHNMEAAIRFTLADEQEQQKIREGFKSITAMTKHEAYSSGTTCVCYVPPMIQGQCASHRDYPNINGSVGGDITIRGGQYNVAIGQNAGYNNLGSCNYYCGQVYPNQCRPITEGFQGFVTEANDGTCIKLTTCDLSSKEHLLKLKDLPEPPKSRLIRE